MAAETSNSSPKHCHVTVNSSGNDSWDAEEDSQNLFQKHSIAEIIEVEKRARGDIERKKEDLRQKVGDGYRDLIDAADTIGEMKMCSNKINSSIKTIQGNCKELYQTHQSRGVTGHTTTPVNQSKVTFYSIASQMKLLVDIPEKVWNSLEHHEYLKAAQLYLLAQNIVSSLHIDTGGSTSSKFLNSFPILSQQWSSISHFMDSILQGSRKLLRDYTQSEQTMADCLCAIMFLEDSSPRQVFNEFLLARQASLQELFDPRQQVTGIKTQLCEVVRLVMSTIYQVYVLFCCDENEETVIQAESEKSSLLFETMKTITSRNDNSVGDLLKHLFGQEFDLTLLRHLPASVIRFRPRIRSVSNGIPCEYIQNNCKAWFEKCVEDVRTNINGFLQYIGTLKALGSIRDAIWELLNPTINTSSHQNIILKHWDAVAMKCLGSLLSLWHKLFKDEFVSRSKAILQGQLEALAASCKSATCKVLDDLSGTKTDRDVLWERDVSLYVWSESSNDLTAKIGKQFEGDVPAFNESCLAFKTKACTPIIQGLCRSFNDRLSHILEDAGHFVKLPKVNLDSSTSPFQSPYNKSSSLQSSDDEGPFDRYDDSAILHEFLQATCADVVKSLLGYFDSLLETYNAELKAYPWEKSKFGMETPSVVLAIDRALLLARLCRSLSDYCPNLAEVMGEKKEEKTRKSRYNKTPLRKKVNELSSSKHEEMKEHFKSTYTSAFSIWSQWISLMFRGSFEFYLQNAVHLNTLLTTANWDEIVIDEETESGEKVNSSIRVPSQVSSYVTTLLFSLCEEINRIGGHAVERYILRDLVRGLSDDVLLCYENLLHSYKADKEIMDQNRALQSIFDFKFLSTIFNDRSKTENEGSYKTRFEKIVEELEDIVDPFDLNVFTPYMSSNLSKHIQRCGVLFGVIMCIDKHSQFYGVPQKSTRSSQDQHNILPIAINPVRFTLLPLSSHHNDRSETPAAAAKTTETRENEKCDPIPFYKHQNFQMNELLLNSVS